MGGLFLGADFLRGAEGGVPPKKNSIFFQKIISQQIDRKSQEVSATYVKLLGRDRCWKKVWVNLTTPRAFRVQSKQQWEYV